MGPYIFRKKYTPYNDKKSLGMKGMVNTMKKAIVGIGLAYTVITCSIGIYWIAHPEKYGEWMGKYLNGLNKLIEG